MKFTDVDDSLETVARAARLINRYNDPALTVTMTCCDWTKRECDAAERKRGEEEERERRNVAGVYRRLKKVNAYIDVSMHAEFARL